MLLNLVSLWFLLVIAKIAKREWTSHGSAACYHHLAPVLRHTLPNIDRYVKMKGKMAKKCGFLSVIEVALRPCTCMRMRGPPQTTCDAIISDAIMSFMSAEIGS